MTERPWRPWEQAAKRRGRALKIAVVSQTRTPSDATAAASQTAQTAQGEARHIGDLDGDILKPYLSHHPTWRHIPERGIIPVATRVLDSKGLKDKGVNYCSDHLRRLHEAGRFPKPFRFPGSRKKNWFEDEIDAYLGYLRRLFNWAIGTHEFGVQGSPVERLSSKDLIGKRQARERTLSDYELRAVWNAAGVMGYPYGHVFRLLTLTGQREREVADMRWSEVNIEKGLWTIPVDRMKGGRAHQVPLAPEALALLQRLPRFTGGECVFTTTGGVKPVNGFSKAKSRIDKLSGVAGWVIHDLRRTMRTHLSALPVPDLVRELVIAHAKPGLHKVYDQHA